MKTNNNEPEKDLKKSFYLGERIKKARKHANYTQATLAECIGVTRQTVNNWENGTATPDYDTLKALCDYLKCDAGYLFGEYDEYTCVAKSMKEYTGLSDENIEQLHEHMTCSFPDDKKAINFVNCLIENHKVLYVAAQKKFAHEYERIKFEDEPFCDFLRKTYRKMRKGEDIYSLDLRKDNFAYVASELALERKILEKHNISQADFLDIARDYFRFLEEEYLGTTDNLITILYLDVIDEYFEKYDDPYKEWMFWR